MESGPLDWDLALEVEIWTSMLVSGPSGYDLGLEARIFASRLGLGSQDRDLRGGMKEEEEEKILFMKCATKYLTNSLPHFGWNELHEQQHGGAWAAGLC